MAQYSPRTWNTGDPITAAKLNALEQGAGNAAVVADIGVAGTPTGDAGRAAYGLTVGTYAARPAASSVPVGARYLASDTQETYRATGTSGQPATGWQVTGPGGAELGYAEVSGDFSTATIGSWVQVPGATVTVTVGERPVMVEIEASVTGATGDANLSIFQDGTEVARVPGNLATTSDYAVLHRQFRAAGLTPGSTHTWDLRLYNNTGQNVTLSHYVPGPVAHIGVVTR